MKFGIFDHLDDSGLSLPDHLEARLQMAEIFDVCGFHCIHVAEHHGTPLGHAPSPSVYLAALSQRTCRIRFGPLVYLLPLYHPLRLIEEIAMLDALSGGRFQFGYGRGISPIEMGFYGINMAEQQERAAETLEIVLKGLSRSRLSHQGSFYSFDDVPMAQNCVQNPHPPLWYGTNSPASAGRCGREGLNMVTLLSGERMHTMLAEFRSEFLAAGGVEASMPLHGVGRHILVADTDEEAIALARPAFALWRDQFVHLWKQRGAGSNPFIDNFPKDWDAAVASGSACAGSPQSVRKFISMQAGQSGFNYFVAQLAFGGLSVCQVKHSAQLFASEVMPAFA